MELHVGGDFAGQAHGGEILDDHAVGSGFGDGGDDARGFFELVFEEERVEGYVAADAAGVQGTQGFGEFVEVETGFGAGGEVFQAEVDAVGAGFDGGVELGPVAGGALYFWLARYFWFTFHWCCTAVTPTSAPMPCETLATIASKVRLLLSDLAWSSPAAVVVSFKSTWKPADWS